MNFSMDINTIIFILLLVTVIVLLYYVFILNKKINKFLINGSTNLDESISIIRDSISELDKFQKEMTGYLTTVEKRLNKSIQAVHTVRFNPFKGTGSGSNQSFSTAFLNEKKDGVIISSLYSREHISVYSKPVKNGASEYELSGEEKESLENAEALLN